MTSLRPRLVVADAAGAIDFYARVFGARETERHAGPDGRIAHAVLAVGDAVLTLKDEDATDRAATSRGGAPVLLSIEVDDADATVERAVAHGATVVFPVGDGPGGRAGRLADPYGHTWIVTERPREADWDHPLTDLCTPWCVRVAATLRIAEHLSAGPAGAADLAAAAGCDAAALRAVLGHLAAKGVFAEPAPGRFALNDTARRLLAPGRFLDLTGIGGRMAYAWGTLPTYVRTGRPGYHEVFGRPFWEDLAAHPEIAEDFDALIGPAGHGTPDPDLELSDGWDRVRTVVDVGGGTGAMLAEILRARPELTGTLVDLPGTVARAAATFRAAGMADRVRTAAGSFFDPLPAGADLYLLKSVLNDWPDEETVAILRRCAEAAAPDGRILIMGGVAPDDAPSGLVIEMVLVGGRSNGLAEFRDLAARAGLEVVAAGRQRSGRYVVECRPAGMRDTAG